MRICVFGLWHSGCVTAACLARLGFDVQGLDPDKENVVRLQKGRAPLYEPGLDDLIQEGVASGHLSFSGEPAAALADAEALWVAFDTPIDENDAGDAGFIERHILAIAPQLKNGTKVVISSQVPVGFTRKIRERMQKAHPDKQLFFAYAPENLRLGRAIKLFLEPDRIVVGTLPQERQGFLQIFSAISTRLEWMGVESAEMTKHAINGFLAASVSFANEIAAVCEHVGADAKEVERGLKSEERIGPKAYLSPGAAFAGGTLARDILFLSETGVRHGLPMHLIRAVKESNDFHKAWVQRKCLETLGDLRGKQVAVLGLTYRPDTDTLRRSYSIELCLWLNRKKAKVKAFDPSIKELPNRLKGPISLARSPKEAIQGADGVVLATEWPIFLTFDKEVIDELSGKVIIDPNGFIEKQVSAGKDIRYVSVGRASL